MSASGTFEKFVGRMTKVWLRADTRIAEVSIS
jgi:hypothetical protein